MRMRLMLGLLVLAIAGSAAAHAQQTHTQPAPTQPAPPAAAPAAASPVTADEAQRTLSVLRDEKRRQALIETLDTIVRAAPEAPVAARAGVPAEPPAAASRPAEAGAAAVATPLTPGSLGAQLIVQVSAAAAVAGNQLGATVRSVNDLPLLWRWLTAQANDPEALARIGQTLWKLAAVLAIAFAAEQGGALVLRRLRHALARGAVARPASPPVGDAADLPDVADSPVAEREIERSVRVRRFAGALNAFRRLPYLLGRLVLDLIPIALFALVGDVLLGTALGEPSLTRLAITAAVQAYVAVRVVLAAAAMFVSPVSPHARLLHISDWAALFVTRWTRRIALIALLGYGVAELGLLFGMYRTAYETILKLAALLVHACLVVAVLQTRVPVARRIRARPGAPGVWALLRNRASEVWHLVAIFYIVALWLIWAIELQNGYVRLLRFFLVTAAVMVSSRLLAVLVLGGFDRLRIGPEAASRHPGLEARLNAYYPIIRGVLMTLVGCATVLALVEAWGLDVLAWLQATGLGGRSLSAALLVGLTVVMAVLVWEGANAGFEMHLATLGRQGQLARAGRLRTLLPMLRTVLLVVVVALVVLMTLSEVGVNIAPLLAGAGVIGIAVGFGSQKLVQDLITGLFLLLENAMQVGDVVTLGGLSGTVEALSIRTIRLRALDGSIHIIPFSAVTTVTNQTRDYGYAVLDVSVGLNEEPGRITPILKDVAEEMRADPAWADLVLEPLDIMGLDRFIDTAWVLRAKIKTQPSSRWAVGRELNRRIKLKFDELAIESPFTSHRVLSAPASPAEAAGQEKAA